jgi:hypothetical protein
MPHCASMQGSVPLLWDCKILPSGTLLTLGASLMLKPQKSYAPRAFPPPTTILIKNDFFVIFCCPDYSV